MITIEHVETFHVSLPLRRTHKWTGLTEPIGGYILVKLVGVDGTIGWGEAPVLKDWGGDYGKYYGETPGMTIQLIQRYLAPVLIGSEAGNFAELHQRMDRAIKGYPYAKAALEMAAYDLVGQALGVSVWMLLGGRARNSILVTHSIGLLAIEEAVQECVQVVSEGIKTIKLKVGIDSQRDIEIVRQVREAVGPDVDICVDANQGYSNPHEAIRTVRAMESYRLKYVEQPVEGVARLAEVARAIDTPVMADESAWTAHDVLEISERKAAEIVSIYTTKPGGLFRAMEMAAVARAAGLLCNVNGSVETGVGNRANIQLAAAIPGIMLSCVVPVSTPAEAQKGQMAGIYYKDDLITAPFIFSEGSIKVPEESGMGMKVDPAKVARYQVKSHE